MGYYTGNGVTSGGNDRISIAQTFLIGATVNLFRRDIITVNVKSGVSLQTAQAVESSITTANGDLHWGVYTIPVPNRNGTIVSPSYSKIGDSNLYELTTETDVFHHKLNNSNWDS